jgi:hypothetical protein
MKAYHSQPLVCQLFSVSLYTKAIRGWPLCGNYPVPVLTYVKAIQEAIQYQYLHVSYPVSAFT